MPGGRSEVLEAFGRLVLTYGRNLTAHRTWDTLWKESILDSLYGWRAFLAWYGRDVSVVVDVGSGAGFPGMVLALAYPQYKVHLVDSRKKAISFLEFAAVKLGISNVEVHWGRFQDLDLGVVDVLTSRAVAPMDRLCEIITGSPTRWSVGVLWKGPRWKQEMSEEATCRVVSAKMYNVPGSDKRRFVVMVRRKWEDL